MIGHNLSGATSAWQGTGGGRVAANEAPKELGYLQRLNGICSGVGQLRERLVIFSGRLNGDGEAKELSPMPGPAGIPATLSSVEADLRACMEIIGKMNDQF